MKKKTSQNAGFSLTEMLMTLLILSMLVLVVGGGVTVVKNSYDRITRRAEAETLLSTAITAVNGELRTSSDIRYETVDDGSGTKVPRISFQSDSRGYRIYLYTQIEDNSSVGAGQIMVGNNQTTSGIPLLTSKTMSSNLKLKFDITTENGDFDSTTGALNQGKTLKYTITVYDNTGKQISTQDIVINPVNR